MGFLDRLLGREEREPAQRYSPPPAPRREAAPQRTDDEIAVERYQYLLRTAPPETIEQVHTEAFARLTPEQRDLLFRQLSENASPSERPANAEPATLAKAATRAELQQPGTLARSFGGQGQGQGGMSFGGMVGSSMLGTIAGYVIGSAIVSAFMPMGGEADAGAGSEGGDTGGDTGGAEASGADASGADAGSDSGGGFGDFGGGDFGGDFGF